MRVGGSHPFGLAWAAAAHREELWVPVLASHAALWAAALASSPGCHSTALVLLEQEIKAHSFDFGMAHFSSEVVDASSAIAR